MHNDPTKAFADIGLITHHFEQCEYYLSEMFNLLCEAENDAPFQIFGQIVSSNLRLSMTRTALGECMPRPSSMKTAILKVLAEFEVCQALRNKAVHANVSPAIKGRKMHYTVVPLQHQTLRYKNGLLKEGRKFTLSELHDAEGRILHLALDMKFMIRKLATQLATRRQRRLRRLSLERGHRRGAS